jgi:RimJ/RimL family protein N-acetyltransferase
MLLGDHTGLRAIEREDLPQLREWRNKPELRRHFREYREIGTADQERWFERTSADPNTLMFAVVDRADGRLLGAGGLCFIDWVNRNCDLSIYIGADGAYIDDRFAPDAARTMLRYGFDELGIHRVWVEIYDFDEPKKVLLDELGFQLEGRHREHHFAEAGWHDSLFYGLLEGDWRAANDGH